MRHIKKWLSLYLILALAFGSVVSVGQPLLVLAEEKQNEKIVVYVAAQGKSSDGEKKVSIGKTPVQLEEGATADMAIRQVLDGSEYKENYVIEDTGYGPYLESIYGMGTEVVDAENWIYNYWSFYVNGNYSNVGMGSCILKDGDQISLIYSYDDTSTEAAVFCDDETLNPQQASIETAEAAMRMAKDIVAKDVFAAYFSDGHIPGLGNADELYVVFSLARAGFKAPEFYGKVQAKLTKQLTELATKGTTYDAAIKADVTEETFRAKKAEEQYLSKIVLAMTALGMDAETTGGYNVIEKMAKKETLESSSPYSRETMMLLALDAGNYALPKGELYCTRGELVKNILEDTDNQIGISVRYGSVDNAVMAIQPMAPYTESQSVEKVCQKVVSFAGKMQDAKGYVGDSYCANNPWSLAQTMTMLGEMGIHPMVETEGVDFVKNGNTLADAALEFVDFKEEKTAEMVMSFQPEQFLRGLTSFVYGTGEKEESLYRVKTIPEIHIPKEPFEEEKPVASTEPSPVPTVEPSSAPTTVPSLVPTVSPGIVPSTTIPKESSAKKETQKKNPVKKISPLKKKILLKKGKSTKIVLKVTSKNAKAVTTDKVKVTGKKIKVKKVDKTAGKITIKVQALKKGNIKVKIKVGKASAKVLLKVK